MGGAGRTTGKEGTEVTRQAELGSRRDPYASDPYARGNLPPTDPPLETGGLPCWKHKTLGKTMSQRKGT